MDGAAPEGQRIQEAGILFNCSHPKKNNFFHIYIWFAVCGFGVIGLVLLMNLINGFCLVFFFSYGKERDLVGFRLV